VPYLNIRTNTAVADAEKAMTEASRITSEQLGKPERYVMVSLEGDRELVFAGTSEPTAYMDLKSIGLPADRAAALSRALCSFAERVLGVSQGRVYINFENVEGSMWGWNGGTF
jgi:phenylpyruvate tautomerase PptA (4-oxalocrotonate tautomerase family)